jgi:hypothetical protein
MFAIVIALILMAIAVGAIYLILKNMGEEGIEIAAPGSCKSGRCGVRCSPVADERREAMEEIADEGGEIRRRDVA